ncbi:MAG: HAMP domain-containing histidine kinase [Gammaproteobacteria bacterium]|nr:HAMP domain-containing histidine kinase [Gammaproteobacteria bacterium]
MIRQIAHSLSARLLGVFLATSIVYVVASRYTFDLVWGTGYLSEVVGGHMALHIDYVLKDLGNPPSIERAEAIVSRVPMDIMLRGPDLNWSSSPAFPPLDRIPFQKSEYLLPYADSDHQGWTRLVQLMELARFHRRAFVKITDGDYEIIFAAPKFSETPQADLATPAVAILAIFVLSGCYFSVRWLVRPIRWIKEGAARIGQGDLSYRIPTTRRDDLGELAADINRMADDVGEMLEAKRQLLLAISHELRSPLTRAKVALEFLEDESVKGNLMQDIKEMERLIADLLESERLNTRHSKLQVADLDLAALVSSVISTEFAETSGRIRLECPPEPLSMAGDATRLRLLVRNLVENALRYTPVDGQPVEVTVAATGTDLVIRVQDRGRGMSAHDLARATEPFYRADPARSRATGGLGLGLYLCRRIAEAHGGTLSLASELGSGTEVSVRLPRRPPA